MRFQNSISIAAVIGATLCNSGFASAASVFSETFSTLTGGPDNVRALGSGNWEGYIGNDTTAPTVIRNDSTAPSYNTGSHRAGTVNGSNGTLTNYLFAQNQSNAPAGIDYFLYTTSNVTAFAPNEHPSLVATWSRNGDALVSGSFYYMTVQVGGNWYASQTGFNTTTSVTFNFSTSLWSNLIIGSSLAVGPTTSTFNDLFGSGQQVTGVGFFIDNLSTNASSSRTIRIDNINIESVPEPSVALLGLIGAAAMVSRRRS